MPENRVLLTQENYQKGFLLDTHPSDSQWMGGIGPDPEKPGQFIAYIADIQNGNLVSSHLFETLDAAISALNAIDRGWHFQELHACGDGTCGQSSCSSCGACEH